LRILKKSSLNPLSPNRFLRQVSKVTFEDKIDVIEGEIIKRRGRWRLDAIPSLSFEDVSQIIRVHIWQKWGQWNQKLDLLPWLNTIITNQIKNLIRNKYSNYSRPCLRCYANQGNDLCSITESGEQCSECPLYAKWEKSKKHALNTKLPLSLENHKQEVYNLPEDSIDIEKTALILHNRMKLTLKPIEWQVYQCLYIDGVAEEETIRRMGYKTEANRSCGCKRMRQLKKIIITKVKKVLEEYGTEQ
jgi:hypothetical protein